MDVLVAGAGRSGTSVVFRTVCEALENNGPLVSKYEPYLWNVNQTRKCGDIVDYKFDSALLNPFGIHVHCDTPLSLHSSPYNEAAQVITSDLHEKFVTGLFPQDHTGAVAAKVIRGLGRIADFQRLRPAMKIVLITRNCYDTVNSAAANFSFFGDEFHPTDRFRFWRDEVVPAGLAPKSFSQMSEDELSVLWWRINLNWAARIITDSTPETCLLVPYEAFRIDRTFWRRRISEFLGVAAADDARIMRSAGPTTGSVYLTGAALDLANQHHRAYEAFLNRFAPGVVDLKVLRTKLGEKYTGAGRQGVTTKINPNISYLSLRQRLIKTKNTEVLTPARLQSNAILETADALKRASRRGPVLKPRAPVVDATCVIAVHNGAKKISDTISSLMLQVGARFSEIIVVDDCSTDRTVEVVQSLGNHETIKLIRNAYNVGPGASRHKAIMAATSRFVTQIDADDLAGPEKLACEFAALEGRDDRVAYSPIMVVNPDGGSIETFDSFDRQSDKFNAIATRRFGVPRDMTFSRALYVSCGGYAPEMWKYEDWLLKMRLAQAETEWVNSGARIGTVYDRTLPGLSQGNAVDHFQHKIYALSRMRHENWELPQSTFAEAVRICLMNMEKISGIRRDIGLQLKKFVASSDFDQRLATYWLTAQIGAPSDWVEAELIKLLCDV